VRRSLCAGADPRDVHAVIAPVDSLGPASYKVEWRVVSADGHPVDGIVHVRRR
jgi:methionine-rich copper-binding protein CopC